MTSLFSNTVAPSLPYPRFLGLKIHDEETITRSSNRARAVFLPRHRLTAAKKSQLDATWELVAGQQLPKGARDIKIISGGHFIVAA